MDDNGDRKIDKQEFYYGLQDLGAGVTKREADLLLTLLDINQDGSVNYDEFLVGIRGKPNEERQKVIDQAFCKFDSNGDGCVTAADLSTVYDCSSHPLVIQGKMTSEEVFVQFLGSFGDKNGDGTITKSEWNDYYAAVSSSVDNDEHFIALMVSAWRL